MFFDRHEHHDLLFAIGRRRGHRHHHAWGRGGGFWGSGDGGVPGARKLSAADLQLLLLILLEQAPAHGYELIRAIEERSGGFYKPSPGVIYPALTYLDEIDHAAAEPEGHRKLYRITDLGRQHLEGNRAYAEAILEALQRVGGRMDEVREAFAGLDGLDADGADQLHEARRALKQALFRKRGAGPEEGRRIADILRRATADILGR